MVPEKIDLQGVVIALLQHHALMGFQKYVKIGFLIIDNIHDLWNFLIYWFHGTIFRYIGILLLI